MIFFIVGKEEKSPYSEIQMLSPENLQGQRRIAKSRLISWNEVYPNLSAIKECDNTSSQVRSNMQFHTNESIRKLVLIRFRNGIKKLRLGLFHQLR